MLNEPTQPELSEEETAPEVATPGDGAEETDGQEISTTYEADLTGGADQISYKKFGTFSGVIRPTILTILGVMMYLREGWVVGNAGLGGAILIILTCYFITGTTALSLSSISTNIRLGAGGVFSLATHSLGLEVGGSIGIPFYLAQSLSVAMYMYGFTEGWLRIFPSHPPLVVVFAVFIVIFTVSYLSTTAAFRLQLVVMSGVLLALTSMLFGLYSAPELQSPEFFGSFAEASYWTLFAIFFPAATGIMVGASMAGNLRNPRKSVPGGTMVAWGVSLVVYVGLAIWYALVATPTELTDVLTIAVDRAFWGPAVLIGILSSCFTAALSSFVASPRTLQALGQHQIVPFSSFLGRTHDGEPRNAILFTGVLVMIVVFIGDLNDIAQIVTVFFLMTYFTVNFVLLIEKRLNLISFRPTFRVPLVAPFAGSLACLSAIVVVSPFLGLTCVLLSIAIYIYLDRRSLDNPYESLNSGLFTSIANWAARKVSVRSGGKNLRSWKPDILYPVERATQLDGNYRLLLAAVYPQGSVQVIGVRTGKSTRALKGLEAIVSDLRGEGIFTSVSVIEAADFLTSLRTASAVMKSSFFRPNILFVPIENRSEDELRGMIEIAGENQFGVIFLANHPETGLGRSRIVNLWVRDQSPDWKLSFNMANLDLPLLMTLMLTRNWKIKLRLIVAVSDAEWIDSARNYLNDLMVLARMPRGYEVVIEQTLFDDYVEKAPHADLNIFGLGDSVHKATMEDLVDRCASSCLFIRDSGRESVLV